MSLVKFTPLNAKLMIDRLLKEGIKDNCMPDIDISDEAYEELVDYVCHEERTINDVSGIIVSYLRGYARAKDEATGWILALKAQWENKEGKDL